MSEPSRGVGATLAGGVQDIAALLPLIGTDQCEKHVGSALDGGYLYAAVSPLSVFGSLGIVKLGISILISSISIPKLSVSFTFNSYPKLSMTFRGRRWLGARILDNAGFKPVGTVAPLIAMDGTRYAAETRLMEILKEKHIESPEALSVEWQSKKWNVMLVVCTMVAAMFGIVPYIPFTSPQFKLSLVHSPWIFPLLRTVGSCLAAVCCQFLIQSRVISLMKNRIVFMIMNRILLEDLKSKDKDKRNLDIDAFRWDGSLPSEECLWSLERYLLSTEVEASEFSKPQDIHDKLLELHKKHIETSPFSHVFILISWTILFLSLPAAVAGYIGCFTLVSGSQGNGPLIWLGLEGALSIIRILLWAWNPRFDEGTDVTVRVELANDQPLVTTEKNIKVIKDTGKDTLALVPERQFLEWITPYTGPLEQFRNRSSENLALYFTLTGNQTDQKRLYLTVFDVNKRIAVTLHEEEEGLTHTEAVVTCNTIASEMEATLQTAIGQYHPWRINHGILFEALYHYYFSMIHALNRSHPQRTTLDNPQSALLPWKWNLLPKRTESNDQRTLPIPKRLSLTEQDKLYLQRGYEHHLKTQLVENWSRWVVSDMKTIEIDARYDCHHALSDRTSDKAKWELTELDRHLASEWIRREWSLIGSSFELEGILRRRMEECVEQVVKERPTERLREWMCSEFEIERRKRLEKERGHAKERMEEKMKTSAKHAETQGRTWPSRFEIFSPTRMWEDGQEFIDEQWREAIEGRLAWESLLDELVEENTLRRDWWDSEEDKARRIFVEQVRSRFEHWQPQHNYERQEMNVTTKRISDADVGHFDNAYQYPKPSFYAVSKFVPLRFLELQAKVCSATVYDLEECNKEAICEVIRKSTTRSVINVHPDLVDSIPENNHLLYLSSYGKHWQEPPFIQRNRDRWWWDQQMSNSSTFYFSPQGLFHSFVFSKSGTIAHIFIFLQTRTRLRLRLLHFRDYQTSVSIQEKSNVLLVISTNEIAGELRLQDFELDELEPGRHELELVITVGKYGKYCLRDIFVEFFEDLPDEDVGRGENASDLPTDIENNPPSKDP